MKNLIFQCHYNSKKTHDARRRIFDNNYVEVSSRRVKEYADRVGADYKFFDTPRVDFTERHEGGVTYDKTRLLNEDLFLEYDKVLYVDTDIIPLPHSPSIFDLDITHCALAHYPWYNDKGEYCFADDLTYDLLIKCAKQHYDVYNVDHPRLDNGLLKWYNSGTMLWTNRGIREARDSFIPIDTFKTDKSIRRMHGDEVYWNTMFAAVDFPIQDLDPTWNFLWPNGWPCQPTVDVNFWHYSTSKTKDQLYKQWK